jgi:hypothetical protein
MSIESPIRRLPLAVLLACGALTLLAMVMLTAGLLGLLRPALVPVLASPGVAWPLIAVGALFDTGAVTLFLSALRAARNESRDPVV